jgi:hypothetical protein
MAGSKSRNIEVLSELRKRLHVVNPDLVTRLPRPRQQSMPRAKSRSVSTPFCILSFNNSSDIRQKRCLRVYNSSCNCSGREGAFLKLTFAYKDKLTRWIFFQGLKSKAVVIVCALRFFAMLVISGFLKELVCFRGKNRRSGLYTKCFNLISL